MWGECQQNPCRYKHDIEWTQIKGLFISLPNDDAVVYGSCTSSRSGTDKKEVYGNMKDVNTSSSSSSSSVAHNSYSRRRWHHHPRHANYSVPDRRNGVSACNLHQEQREPKGNKPFSPDFNDFRVYDCPGCGACRGK